MPTEKWKNIDKYSEPFTTYNCAFLDILGYKERVNEYFRGGYNLFGRIDRALTKTIEIIGSIEPLLDTNKLQVEIVSDSIVMTQPASGNGLGALILFACLFSSSLSFEDLLVRGGIARGLHLRRQTSQGFDFLASEALQKAYFLEHQAVFPRILVDREIVSSLPSEEKVFLVAEHDSYFVDFAHHVINREASNFSDVQAEMLELSEKMRATSDPHVKQKYQWVLDYYCWTIKKNPNWKYSDFEHYASKDVERFKRIYS